MVNLVQFPGLGLSFEVDRVAFSIGGFNIYWYGILIGGGMLLAMIYAFRYAPRLGINVDRMIDVIFVGTIMAVICARVYYVAMAPFEYASFWQMLDIRDGGIAIYGAVIGAFVFGGLACKWRKVPILPMFDLTSIGFLIGQAVGRWGNFVNQEAFGTNTTAPWGMISPRTVSYLASVQEKLAAEGVMVDPAMPVHPTFLYESIWCLVGFIALAVYLKHRRFHGEVALLYVMWYGLGRAWIEGLRTDSLYVVGSLRASQLLAILSCLAAFAAWLVLRRKYRGRPALGWAEPAPAGAADGTGAADARPEDGDGCGAEQESTDSAAEPRDGHCAPPAADEPEQQEQEGHHGEN
ncbi:prolipoprotein diacylglyceryl transferase [Anaerofilum sp. BX8]|uniref:Phosphatidylglycerol--prolipoprotein diacylglyceryl transferase n=1 Tax=Anaerofilum hominis TaxID=2763016 RepID=A0A923KWM5_9FIRM|nr:prolipoprotein diacylglyceryl transferase [Anaerofilum hominis]MBC5582066.1 prolipoprotein diacylglyceryl transferase [Anaerofilum hominis]